MQNIKISITGSTPMLQHNVQLADPANKWAKQLSADISEAKRAKTDEAWEKAYRTEWYGGLYYDPEIGVYVPSSWIMGAFYRGGVIQGKKGTAIRESLVLEEMNIPLLHDGPSDLETMWRNEKYRDIRSVKVGQNRVQRCRPHFSQWAVNTTAFLNTASLDMAIFKEIATKAGQLAGMGDYRPSTGGGPFGRFNVSVAQI